MNFYIADLSNLQPTSGLVPLSKGLLEWMRGLQNANFTYSNSSSCRVAQNYYFIGACLQSEHHDWLARIWTFPAWTFSWNFFSFFMYLPKSFVPFWAISRRIPLQRVNAFEYFSCVAHHKKYSAAVQKGAKFSMNSRFLPLYLDYVQIGKKYHIVMYK